jgi:hypothetical protein
MAPPGFPFAHHADSFHSQHGDVMAAEMISGAAIRFVPKRHRAPAVA